MPSGDMPHCSWVAGDAHAAAFWMASQGHPVSAGILSASRVTAPASCIAHMSVQYGPRQHWLRPTCLQVPFGVSTPDHLLDLACGDLPGKNDDLQHLVKSFRSRTIGEYNRGGHSRGGKRMTLFNMQSLQKTNLGKLWCHNAWP
jgi:hypothetical protein